MPRYTVTAWHDVIADPTYADAILDRLLHNAHRLDLEGHSPPTRKIPASGLTLNPKRTRTRIASTSLADRGAIISETGGDFVGICGIPRRDRMPPEVTQVGLTN